MVFTKDALPAIRPVDHVMDNAAIVIRSHDGAAITATPAGDGGYMDERGFLYIVDRVKDMTISGGENVLTGHPPVAACAVIGVPDEKWGERVYAVVVRKPHHGTSAEELRQFCRDHIAGYQVPRTWAFAELAR